MITQMQQTGNMITQMQQTGKEYEHVKLTSSSSQAQKDTALSLAVAPVIVMSIAEGHQLALEHSVILHRDIL